MIQENKILTKLEKYIQLYDKIFLIELGTEYDKHFLNDFIKFANSNANDKKWVCLISEELEENYDCCVKITRQELEYIKKIYFMYEFSNRFYFISENDKFGCLWNYVCNGILTKTEAFSAFFS